VLNIEWAIAFAIATQRSFNGFNLSGACQKIDEPLAMHNEYLIYTSHMQHEGSFARYMSKRVRSLSDEATPFGKRKGGSSSNQGWARPPGEDHILTFSEIPAFI
jgi:hypothetical protein